MCGTSSHVRNQVGYLSELEVLEENRSEKWKVVDRFVSLYVSGWKAEKGTVVCRFCFWFLYCNWAVFLFLSFVIGLLER